MNLPPGMSTEDAQLSPDGKLLFFDNHSPNASSSQLYAANRFDFKTFAFIGAVGGVNEAGAMTLRGNYDVNGNFYFVSSLFLGAGMVGVGAFAPGPSVIGVNPVQGVTQPPCPPGSTLYCLDACITADGSTLFTTEAIMKGSGGPQSSQIEISAKVGQGSFSTKAPPTAITAINGSGLVYNSAPSPSGLAFAYTVNVPNKTPQIFLSQRPNLNASFQQGIYWSAANDMLPGGFSESGGFSAFDNHFYFHRNLSPSQSAIYVI